jgi:hypothetical protein
VIVVIVLVAVIAIGVLVLIGLELSDMRAYRSEGDAEELAAANAHPLGNVVPFPRHANEVTITVVKAPPDTELVNPNPPDAS